MALGIDQRHTFAPDQLLGPIVAARPTHSDALDVLRVDDRQLWLRPTSETPPLTTGQSPHHAVKQPLLDPAPNQP